MRHLGALLTLLLLALPGDPTGVLRVRTQPGVEVVWEGVTLGETDREGLLVVEGIPAGEYVLSLRAEGFQQLDVRVEVAPGESSVLEMPLSPGGSEPAAEGLGATAAGGDSEAPNRRPEAGATSAGLSLPLGAVVLLMAALAGTAWVLLSAVSRAQPSEPPAPRPRADQLRPPVFEAGPRERELHPSAFLEDLKRREQNIETVKEGPAPPEETIIEVEATEVRRVDGE